MDQKLWFQTIGVILLVLRFSEELPLNPPDCDISTLEIETKSNTCKVMNLFVKHDHLIEQGNLHSCGVKIRCSNGQLTACKLTDNACVEFAVDCVKLVVGRKETSEYITCVRNRD